MRDEEPLELIAMVYSQDELALLTSRLRWESIWCFSHGERHITANTALTVALGGVRLFVHREDAEDARLLLAEMRGWEKSGGVYDPSRAMDWAIGLLLAVMLAITPARIPFVLVGEAQTASA